MITGGEGAIRVPITCRIRAGFLKLRSMIAGTRSAGSNIARVSLSTTMSRPGEEADAAHVADQRMVGERAERVLHMRADAPDMAEKVHLLVDARHLERDGRAATGCAQ